MTLVNNLQITLSGFELPRFSIIQSLLKGPVTKHSVVNYTQIGGRSSAIRVASRPEGLADNAQGRNSSCPGGLPGLEEDSYLKLRSGFLREFKSMSALFQRCQPALEVGIGRASADEQKSNSLDTSEL